MQILITVQFGQYETSSNAALVYYVLDEGPLVETANLIAEKLKSCIDRSTLEYNENMKRSADYINKARKVNPKTYPHVEQQIYYVELLEPKDYFMNMMKADCDEFGGYWELLQQENIHTLPHREPIVAHISFGSFDHYLEGGRLEFELNSLV